MYGSKKWSIGPFDFVVILKVALYSGASAAITYVLTLTPVLQGSAPTEYAGIIALAIPIVNTLLVALKRFLEDRSVHLEK